MAKPRISVASLSQALARQRDEGSEPAATTGAATAFDETGSEAAPVMETNMAMADGGPDDLPRTFRRERDAQREQREREQR